MPKKKKNKRSATGAPWILWSLLVLAITVRLFYLKFSRQNPFYEPFLLDSAYYHQWALRILKQGFSQDGVFYGLPLYPAFLAFCYKIFNSSIFAVKIIQIFLGILTLTLVYRISLKLADKTTALVAAFLGAIYGPLFFHEGIWIPEILGLPLYTASFYQSLLFWEKPTNPRAILLGVLFGLASLTKAGLIIFVFLLVGAALFRKVSRLPGFLCLLAFFLTLAPVTAHNFIRGKDTVLLTSHAGFNFYVGNNPRSEGVFVEPEGTGGNVEAQKEDSREIAEKALGRSLKPSEVSKYWSDKAWQFIRENPDRFASLCLRKFALFFDAREISDVEGYQFAKNFNPMLRIPWLDFRILGPLVFLGLWAIWRSGRFRGLVFSFVLAYIFGMMAFFVNARYRLPMIGVFLAVGAYGLVYFYRKFNDKAWGSLLGCMAALALGAAIGQLELVGTDWSKNWVNAGDALQEKKEYDRAIELYKTALTIDPKSWKANQAMGVALTKLGRNDEAIDSYQKSIDLDPVNSQSYNNLGLSYDRVGKLDLAERYFLMALEKKPNSWQAHNNLGMVYGKRGENEKAMREFETSLKLHENPRAYTNLGLILHRFGKEEEARGYWRKALSINPDFEEAKKALVLSTAT